MRLGLLTGREKGKPREQLLAALAAGEIDILIGTHALFQPDVVFNDLAVAVIDEQHRFGVHQRMALQSKGGDGGANVLVMTATPIPRTLLMTHYGDLDVSRLERKTGRPQADQDHDAVARAAARRGRGLEARGRTGRADLLGVPADRKFRGHRSGRRRRTRRAPATVLRRQGRPAARRHDRHGQGRRDGALLGQRACRSWSRPP